MNTNHAEVIDFNDLTKRIISRASYTAGAMSMVYDIAEQMRHIPFPPGYVDTLRDEMLGVLKTGIPAKPTFVYLAFYGFNGRASHMKIGVANNVKNRMASIRTGNPLQNLWTYAAAYPTRVEAMQVESSLLAHMAADSVHGEWVSVGSIGETEASVIVESLSGVAADVAGCRVSFRIEGDPA